VTIDARHTGVHRVARRFVEPTQDILVLGVGVALFRLMLRTLGRRFVERFGPPSTFA
jgi:hypothetical protein